MSDPTSELEALRRFAGWVLSCHLGSIDGCEIEDQAVELGLMREVGCDGSCADCHHDEGMWCYRPALNPEGVVLVPWVNPSKGGQDGAAG